MDIHVITSDPQLLSALKQQIEALPPIQNGQLATAICRSHQQPLASTVAALVAPIDDGLLLLETDEQAPETEWQDLASLTALHPRLNVVLMSRDAHKEQLLSAMRAGVREVIPCPPDDNTLQATLQRWTDPQGKAPRSSTVQTRQRGQLIAFMACKGGAGSTFLATSLAHMLATEFERPGAFIDLDLLYGDASFYLGQTAHPNTVADLATPAERLDSLLLASCMYTVTPGLQMLSAPPDIATSTALQAHHIEKVLTLACMEHPLVVMDLPRNLEPRCIAALTMADVVYLVMDSSMAALRDAQRCLQFMQTCGCDSSKIRLILNKHASDTHMDPQTVQGALGMRVRHQIPQQNDAVNECINLGQAMGQVHPHSPVAVALRQVAVDLLALPAPSTASRLTPWLRRWLGRSSHHAKVNPSDTAALKPSPPGGPFDAQ
jgi:pilus assembly protein CpaE